MTGKDKQPEKEKPVKKPQERPNTVDYVKKTQDKKTIKKR